MEAYLSLCRKIEDRALSHGLSLEMEVDVDYSTEGLHGNDARAATSKYRLCPSATHEARCQWNASVAFANRGKIKDVPLIPVTQMRQVPHETGRLPFKQFVPQNEVPSKVFQGPRKSSWIWSRGGPRRRELQRGVVGSLRH